jgi:hypothetical protein
LLVVAKNRYLRREVLLQEAGKNTILGVLDQDSLL